MEKNYEIYKINDSGKIVIRKTKEKEASGYLVGASNELVDAMLCEVKWEIKKLELEIKKYKVMMYIENDQENDDGRKEAELKIELLKEQALSREFVRGVDRVLNKIRDIYSEKSKFDNRVEMIKKIEDLRKEKDFLKDILIKQMSTYSLLKSLHRYKTYNQNMGNNYRYNGIEPIEIEENMMNYEEIFPPKISKSQPDQSLYKILNKLMKDRMYLLEKGIKIENVLSDSHEINQYL